MSNIVIVTKHCYLTCETINHIKMEEYNDSDSLSHYNKMRKIPESRRPYIVTIDFIPLQCSSTSRHQQDHVRFTLIGKKHAEKTFKEIVSQIREQVPDKLFLDKLVDQLLVEDKPKRRIRI